MIGTLTIDLRAIQDNYKTLSAMSAKTCETACCVKANAYGLGLSEVAPALAAVGARKFFIATLNEGIELRAILPTADIYILNGFWQAEERVYKAHNLIPVLNDTAQINQYKGAAILHFDTGMNRLGIPQQDWADIDLSALNVHYLMSHFSSSEEPDNPRNAQQFELFQNVIKIFPGHKYSLCNSAGITLSKDYHFDLTRPGIGLYGGMERMKPVITLDLPILQIHTVKRGETAGYNETYRFEKDGHVAVIGAGYADGLHRTLGNAGALFWQGYKLPIRGRVSMDLIICDLSDVPESKRPKSGDSLELMGPHQTLTDLAASAGTIPYEILTSLGKRYNRRYS